ALRQMKLRGEQVAVLLADYRMPEMNGIEFLEQAMDIYPAARRALLTAYADTGAAIEAINVVDLDYYLLKPWDPPEEKLYPGGAGDHAVGAVLRSGSHRRRPGRPGRGRLRRLGGAADRPGGADRDRRAGGPELTDRELPRFPRRGVRGPTHRAGQAAGHQVR